MGQLLILNTLERTEWFHPILFLRQKKSEIIRSECIMKSETCKFGDICCVR